MDEATDAILSLDVVAHEIASGSADCYLRVYNVRDGKMTTGFIIFIQKQTLFWENFVAVVAKNKLSSVLHARAVLAFCQLPFCLFDFCSFQKFRMNGNFETLAMTF